QAWPEAKRKSFHQGRKPESGTTITRVAMFLPPEERSSTAAFLPIASWPSILASESMRNVSFSGSFPFKSSVNSCPRQRRSSLIQSDFGCRSCLLRTDEAVERPTASVKQTRKNVTSESAKQNHITGQTFR